MTAGPVLKIDDRSCGMRRRLGALAWVVLEEAALSATTPARTVDPVGVAVSVRWVVERVGVGKASAARAIAVLVDAGVLVRLPGMRGDGGRWAGSGYLLRLPEGVVLSPPAAGGAPVPGWPVTADAVVVGKDVAGADRKARSDRRPGVAGQASLFGLDSSTPASGLDAAPVTPPYGDRTVGAGLSGGCGRDHGVHELAPGVRVPGRSGCDPNGRNVRC